MSDNNEEKGFTIDADFAEFDLLTNPMKSTFINTTLTTC